MIRSPETTPAKKHEAICQALADGEGLFEIIARRYAVYPGIDRIRDFDDVLQLVREQALFILQAMADGSDRPGNFEAQLSKSAHSAIRDYADSRTRPMIGRGGAANRRAQLEIAQRELDGQIGTNSTPMASVVFGVTVESPTDYDASNHLEMQSVIDTTLREIACFESATLLEVGRMLFGWFPNDEKPSSAGFVWVQIPARTALAIRRRGRDDLQEDLLRELTLTLRCLTEASRRPKRPLLCRLIHRTVDALANEKSRDNFD